MIASVGTMFAETYSGSCGEDLTWSLNTEDSVLTISGTGFMESFNNTSDNPWYVHRTAIKSAIIGRGVTSIGKAAFYDCTSLTSVTIPNSVTFIEVDAFSKCSGLTSVTIPNNVTSIENGAFEWCSSLTSMNIPDGVTKIGRDAFRYCNGLTSVSIPVSITQIAAYAFEGCNGLTRVNITDLTAWCNITFNGSGSNPLSSAKHLYLNDTEITNLVIPESISEIGSSTFYNCSGITSVTIPNSVTHIGEGAFSCCTGLTSLVIPNSVTRISGSAFSGCSGLTSIEIPNSVTTIGSYAFSNCYGLTSVTIPNSITRITKGAFFACSNLISVTIPSSVTRIDESAFSKCYGLTKVNITDLAAWCNITFSALEDNPLNDARHLYLNDVEITDLVIPESVTSISNYVFYRCESLTSLTIPNSVTSIGSSAFHWCTGITSITCKAVIPPTSSPSAFQWIDKFTPLYVPAESVEAYKAADVWKEFTNILPIGSESMPYIIASGTCGAEDDNLKWTLTSDSVLTISGTGAMEDYESYTATLWYSNRESIKSIVIKEGVTSIGKHAFCSLNNLTSVTIPNSVTVIGNYAFGSNVINGCSNLTAVHISDLAAWCNINFNASTSNPLNYAKNLYLNGTLVEELVIPDGITKVNDYAFYNCSSLTSVTIPNSVTSIGKNAFNNCKSLVSVTIPNDITSIGSSAFVGCSSLNAVNISDLAAWCNISFSAASSNPLNNAKNLYLNGILVEKIVIPNGVTEINDYTFYNCSSLTSVTIPNGVTSIGNSAFYGCSSMTAVTIPSSVTTIGSSAFGGCSSLNAVNISDLAAWCNISFKASSSNPLYYAKNLYLNGTLVKDLVIPNGVTKINDYAFSNCSSLTSATIPNSVTSIGTYSFYGCSSMTSITIPNGVTSIGSSAFYGCSSMTAVTIPSSITTIESNAFNGCSSLTAVNISDLAAWCNISFKASSSNPLYYAKNLYLNGTLVEELVIPNGVSKINKCTFYNCSSLTSVAIPNSVTTIGSYAFSGCSGLTSVTIPNSVDSIGTNAFRECTGITSLTISNSVTTIESAAFWGCTGLTSITNLATTPQAVSTYVFGNPASNTAVDYSVCTLYVPAESVEAYKAADVWKEFTNILPIGESSDSCVIASGTCGAEGDNLTWTLTCDSVLTISGTGEMADYEWNTGAAWYSNKESIKSVIIENGVTSIGVFAFKDCHVLLSVEIPNSVTSIGSQAFQGSGLSYVRIPSNVTSLGLSIFAGCSDLSSIDVDVNNPYYCSIDGVLFKKYNTILKQYPGGKQGAYAIPNGVTSIDIAAFYGCSGLTSVEIPNSVTSIGEWAFYSCSSLTSIDIPNSVTSIGRDAFWNCTGLTSVSISNSVTSIGEETFADCISLTSFTNYALQPQMVNSNVFVDVDKSACTLYVPAESIEAYKTADVWKEFGTILPIGGQPEVNDTLTIVEAIQIGMALDSMETSVETYTIEGYVINAGTINQSFKYQNWYMADDPNVTSSDFQAYRCYPIDGLDTTEVRNGSKVRMTGKLHKYYDRTKALYVVEMINIPATILSKPQIDTITVAEALAIGAELAENANTAKQYVIRGYVSSVTTPFSEQNGDQNFYIADDSLSTAGSTAAGGFYVYRGKPATGTAIKEGALVEITCAIKNYRNINIENHEYPVTITILQDGPECRIITGTCGDNLTWTFNNCDSVLTISGTGAMDDYTSYSATPWSSNRASIKFVIIEDGVTSIGSSAFYGCTGLTSVTIGNSVTSIGNYAFWYCSGLTSVTIPNSVTSIGDGAFYNCTGLTSVTIPNSVTSIGWGAFCECTGLTSPVYNAHVFAYIPTSYSGAYTIPDGIESIAGSAFFGCSGLTSITIPNSITSIGNYAFCNCTGLTSVTIPDSVTSIGEGAFYNCTGLTSVTIEAETPPTLGSDVFYDINNCPIYVPCGTLDAYKSAWSDYADRIKYEYTIIGNVNDAKAGSVDYPTSACGDVVITAIPNYGYHFTQWSDGNTDNPRTIELTQDTTFTAEFAYDRAGTCGKDLALVWSYDPTNKVLTIGNAGSFTENMQFGLEAPNEMEELVIGNAVTAIGANAFAGIETLKKIIIGESVKTIGEQAFYNCVNLETIFNYRPTPTNTYSNAFDGVDKFECVLYVLPSSIDMYKNAAVWRDFYYTYAIGAEETTVTTNDVKVEPQDNAVTLTWPTSNNAASYTIQITKDGVVFCTLIFNSNGQLTGIAFAPSRDGQAHAPAALMTANGLQFTVTGLDSGTQYGYSVTAKDANDQTVATYSGSFTTTSEGIATGIDNTPFPSGEGRGEALKLLRDGQIFILRGDKIYNAQGALVK